MQWAPVIVVLNLTEICAVIVMMICFHFYVF